MLGGTSLPLTAVVWGTAADYILNTQYLMALSQAVGQLVLVGNKVNVIAGYTKRAGGTTSQPDTFKSMVYFLCVFDTYVQSVFECVLLQYTTAPAREVLSPHRGGKCPPPPDKTISPRDEFL